MSFVAKAVMDTAIRRKHRTDRHYCDFGGSNAGLDSLQCYGDTLDYL